MTIMAGLGMRPRLLLAQSLVLVAGGLTTWAVALVVGPPLFREHLHQAGVAQNSNEQFHAEQAYQHATAISIAVAIAIAALTAFIAAVYLSRRLQRPIAEVASAATAVSEGRYDIRVGAPRLGGEFDELAAAFNRMAQRLQDVESTRKQMFSDLAHEIRTPVAVLEAYLEAIEDGVKTLDAQTITMLREQAHRLVRFSTDVTALAQAEEAHATIAPAWTDVDQLVAASAASAGDRYAAKGVGLTTHVSAAPRVWADGQRLAQVLGNLLDNALRHTPAGGHVVLTAAPTKTELVFEVTDDGDGIDAEHLSHLFERFYRADTSRNRSQGGSGIGLAIAKALTEAHGGRISAASRGSGMGSSFTVVIPIEAGARSRGRD